MDRDGRTAVIPKRRGARHPSLVPASALRLLESGQDQTANFMEQIALDMGRLMGTLFPEVGHRVDEIASPRLLTRMRSGAEILWSHLKMDLFVAAPNWKSDTARGWAAMAVGLVPDISWEQRVSFALTFAKDEHFGVREWAWLGIRDQVVEDVMGAVQAICPLTQHDSPYVRRFASELTRPIGVWSRHIPALKARPDLALAILDNLNADRTRYVQDSVSNWLNDASKSQPDWVIEVCNRWKNEVGPDINYVYERATRTIRKSRLLESEPGPRQTSTLLSK